MAAASICKSARAVREAGLFTLDGRTRDMGLGPLSEVGRRRASGFDGVPPFAQPHVANFFDQRTRRALDQGKIIAAGRLVELLHAHSDPYPGVTYSQRRACVVAEADKLIFWF